MYIRGMDKESVVFNLAGEKTPPPYVIYWSTPSKPQSSAAMEFLSMAVLVTALTVVAIGMFSGTGSLSSSNANPTFLSSKNRHISYFAQRWHRAEATAFPMNFPPDPAWTKHCFHRCLEWGINISSLVGLLQWWSHFDRLHVLSMGFQIGTP